MDSRKTRLDDDTITSTDIYVAVRAKTMDAAFLPRSIYQLSITISSLSYNIAPSESLLDTVVGISPIDARLIHEKLICCIKNKTLTRLYIVTGEAYSVSKDYTPAPPEQ